MHTGIIIAIIGAVPALITAIVSVALNNRVINVRLDGIEQRLDRMEKKQDETNHVKERVAMLERDEKTAFTRIDEIRDDVHELQNFHK